MVDWNEELHMATERSVAIILKDGPQEKQFCIHSEKTGKNFDCYSTKKQVEDKLA